MSRPQAPTQKKNLMAILLDKVFPWVTGGMFIWVLADPWIPHGPPLDRCLKGGIPYEFSEDDQVNIRKIIQDSELAYSAMNVRHKRQWEQTYLNLHAMPDDVRDALSSAQIEEGLRLVYFFEEKRVAACREAAAKISP